MFSALPYFLTALFCLWTFARFIDFVSELFEHSREGER